MKAPTGRCKLCGEIKTLTQEHLPAKGGYPTPSRVRVLSGDQILEGGRPKPFQNGFWAYALCEDCNGLTGALYGREFAEWTRWGFSLHDAMRTGAERVSLFTGFPARIGKQVASTMIASSQDGFADEYPHLRTFVLNKEAILSAAEFRLAVYVVGSRTGRSTGCASVMKLGSPRHVLVEISLPPFGYVLTLSGEPFDTRPANVGWFAECGYDEQRTVTIPELHVLPTHEAIPCDYRTRDEMRRDIVINILTGEGHPDPSQEAMRIFADGEARDFLAKRGEPWEWGFNRGLVDKPAASI